MHYTPSLCSAENWTQGFLYARQALWWLNHISGFTTFFFLILNRVSLCHPDCLELTIFLPQPPEQWGLQAGTTRSSWKSACLILTTHFDRDRCCQIAFLAPTRAEWFKGKVFQVTLFAEAPMSTLMPDAVNTCTLEWIPPTMVSPESILFHPQCLQITVILQKWRLHPFVICYTLSSSLLTSKIMQSSHKIYLFEINGFFLHPSFPKHPWGVSFMPGKQKSPPFLNKRTP